jgi:hypothetical protein
VSDLPESGPRTARRPSGIRRLSRRPEGQDLLRDVAILQRTVNELRGGDLVPRGLYRFRTHEEAEVWMMQQMALTHSRRR